MPDHTPNPETSPETSAPSQETQGVGSPETAAAAPAQSLDLSPVIPKSEQESVPFETVSVETKPDAVVEAKVVIPAEEFAKRIEKILKDLRDKVVVDGFRRGHAPMRILARIYGKEARADCVEKAKPSIVTQLAKDKNLKVLGDANVVEFKAEEGQPAEITLSFEIIPQVEFDEAVLSGLAVTAPKHELTEEMVDKELEKLQQSSATFEVKPEGATYEKDDGVVVDIFVTDEKDRNVPNLSRLDEFIAIPEENLPAKVINALVGCSIGQHLDVTIPPELGEDGAEKAPALIYHVDLKGLKTRRVPALDDEFAKDVDADCPTVEALREKTRKGLQDQIDEKNRSNAINAIYDALLKKIEFSVPASLVYADAQQTIKQQEEMFKQMGISLAQILGPRTKEYINSTKTNAERRVRIAMVANAIALKKEFKAGEEALTAEFERLGAKVGRSALAIRAQYEAKKRIGDLEQELISRQVEDYLLGQIKVETVPASANADSGESNSGEPNA